MAGSIGTPMREGVHSDNSRMATQVPRGEAEGHGGRFLRFDALCHSLNDECVGYERQGIAARNRTHQVETHASPDAA